MDRTVAMPAQGQCHYWGIGVDNVHNVRAIRYLVTMIAMLAAITITSPVAAAAGTDGAQLDPVVSEVMNSPDPKATYDALTAGERATFDRFMVPAARTSNATITSIGAATAGAPAGINACWRGYADASDQAAAGNTLYTFHIVWDWCASGTTVTWVGRTDVWAETSTPGWRIDYARWRQSGVVYNEGRVVGEFLFILGVGGWDIQHAYRCLRGGGRWNGTVWADRGCSIY